MKHKPHDVCRLFNIKHFQASVCLWFLRLRKTTYTYTNTATFYDLEILYD